MKAKTVYLGQDFTAAVERKTGLHAMEHDPIETGLVAELSRGQVDFLNEASQQLYMLCLSAVDHVISENRFAEFGIDALQADHISASWRRQPAWPNGQMRDPELMVRFDVRWDGTDTLKLYEVNADTPAVLEAAVIQRAWAAELVRQGVYAPDISQMNMLEEKLVERFGEIARMLQEKGIADTMHFTAQSDQPNDVAITRYLEKLAQKAGMRTAFVGVEQIGADENPDSEGYGKLYDAALNELRALYKFYPWEQIYASDFAPYVARDEVLFVEPVWKAVLGNKMLTSVLWELYPNHPLLLPTYAQPEALGDTYVAKPVFGRSGAGIQAVFNGKVISGYGKTGGVAAPEVEGCPFVYQAFAPLPDMPNMPGYRYQAGLWAVGDQGKAAAFDMRVDQTLVLGSKKMKYVPHVVR